MLTGYSAKISEDAMLEKLSDEELMVRVTEEDVDAFEVIFKRYERAIFSYLARMTRSMQLAEDYTQDVFLRLWKNRQLYKPTGKFSSYLYQIAHNYCLNEATRRKIKVSPLPVEEANAFVLDNRESDNPLDILEKQELNEVFEEALEELPEIQREVFIFCRYHQMRYKEIADILDIPVRTVESRLLAATQKLMQKMGSYFNEIEKE